MDIVAKIEDFGGRADDDRDDSAALAQACEAVGTKGGGAVVLGENIYHLDWPVTVRHDGVVIRGCGPKKTRLILRYALPSEGITFFGLKADDRIGRNTPIILQSRPTVLATLEVGVDGYVAMQWERSRSSGNMFCRTTGGSAVFNHVPDGKHTLRGIAKYDDGTSLQTDLPVVLDSTFNDSRQIPDCQEAIVFVGKGQIGPAFKLTRDGRRGERTLLLETVKGLTTGDHIFLKAPPSDRWNSLVHNACPQGAFRECEMQIEQIDGNTIFLSQPLRIDFPAVDGAFVQKTVPIQLARQLPIRSWLATPVTPSLSARMASPSSQYKRYTSL